MDRTLLYYPTIVIRNDQWIRQSILYWDSIGSIVPHGMEGSLHESYDIEILQREGLYRIYRPDDYVQKSENLAREFDEFVADELLVNSLPWGAPGQEYRQRRGWVYESKMYPEIISKLVDRSIAKRKGNKVEMPYRVAVMYMSLLAKHMANDDTEAITTPSTDDDTNIRFLYPNHEDGNRISVANILLHNVLPVPIKNVQVAEIIKFKTKRKDELTNFREIISGYENKLKQVSEPREIRELSAEFIEKLQLEVNNLSKAFHGDKIQFTFGSLRNLLAFQTPVVISALMTGLPSKFQFPLSIVGATVAGAISLGEWTLDVRNKQLDRLAQNKFAYIYLAQKEGLLPV